MHRKMERIITFKSNCHRRCIAIDPSRDAPAPVNTLVPPLLPALAQIRESSFLSVFSCTVDVHRFNRFTSVVIFLLFRKAGSRVVPEPGDMAGRRWPGFQEPALPCRALGDSPFGSLSTPHKGSRDFQTCFGKQHEPRAPTPLESFQGDQRLHCNEAKMYTLPVYCDRPLYTQKHVWTATRQMLHEGQLGPPSVWTERITFSAAI